MRELKYAPGIASIEIDLERCIGCGLCETVCPHEVIHVIKGRARIVDIDACTECGVCMSSCPMAAIEVSAADGSISPRARRTA